MTKDPSSFRDPSGYIFELDGQIYRSVSQSYAPHFEKLTQSGLLEKLVDQQLMISHEVVTLPSQSDSGFAILKPKRLPLITYPYEWSFNQLRDAALLTLEIQSKALEHDMILKDASAYNVQFIGYQPIFIDTLSFAIYEVGQSWGGYRQFCEHFLAPLCISASLGVEYSLLNRLGVDGIPLGISSKLLPASTWFNSASLFHIHLHARSIKLYSGSKPTSKAAPKPISKHNLFAMIDHLKGFISKLELKKSDKTQWGDYDNEKAHYSDVSKSSKAETLKAFVAQVSPSVAWDFGANDGFFSRLIANDKLQVLSLDFDARAVDKNYQVTKKSQRKNVYPLLFDLVNPSPDMGWGNEERSKLSDRSKPDVIVALALIHHLVITNNIPFEKVAGYFSTLAEWLIIEFVPTDDEKILFLPNTAGMNSYNRTSFDNAFLKAYDLVEERKIENSGRSLLLLRKKA